MPANNDPMTFWQDLSGNGRFLSSPTQQLASEPTFKDNAMDNINGLPVVRVAAGQGMDIPSTPDRWTPTTVVTGLSIYALLKYNIAQTDQGPFFISFEAPLVGNQIRLFLDVDEDLFDTDDPPSPSVGWESTTDGFDQIYGLAAAVSGTQVLAWVFDATAGTGKIYRNGVELALTRDDGIHTPNISLGGDIIEFFNQDGAASVTVGDFVEIIGYGNAHSAADVLTISNYLMGRGGLS